MNESTGKSTAVRPAYIALGFTAALVVAASFLPHIRLWGINHLSFHSVAVRVIALALILLSFIPAVNRRVYSGLEKVHRLIRSGRGRSFVLILCSVVTFVLFLSLGSSTVLLGDGIYVYNNTTIAADADITPIDYFTNITLSKNTWSFTRGGRTAGTINPGADLLNFLSAYSARTVFGADVLNGVRALSALMGAFLVTALFVFIRRSNEATVWPLCTALLLLGSGAVQIFCGYVENYAPSFLVGTVYVLAAAGTVAARGSIRIPSLLLALAVVLHAQSLILAPSFVFLVVWTFWLHKHPNNTGIAWKLIVTVTVAGAVVAAISGAAGNHYLKLVGGTYSVFSIQHLLDVGNELLLLIPAALILLVLGVVSPPAPEKDGGNTRTMAAFAWCLLAPCALFLLLFRPDLGMARDWDLFAFTALGFAVPAVLALRRFLRADGMKDHHARIVIPALTLSLVVTFAWITVNADTDRSVKRFRAILEYDKNGQAYALETLAKHFEIRGEMHRQLEALREAYNASRNPRYKVKLAMLQGDEGMMVEGLHEMLALNPRNFAARAQLVQILMTRGDPAVVVVEVAREGIRYSPDNPFFHYAMGRALIAQGKINEGLYSFDRCRQSNPPPQLLREIDMVLEELNRRRENER